MSEILNKKSYQKQTDQQRKRQFFFTKLVILLSLAFFSYYAFKYWRSKLIQGVEAKLKVEKFDNLESEIFDISDEYKSESKGRGLVDLSDLTINEIKEKGAEFIYQILLKNQMQINDLSKQVQDLKKTFLQRSNQEKVGKLIFSYIDLREKFLTGKKFDEELKNFEMLTVFDKNLSEKTLRLQSLLTNFFDQKKLSQSFSSLIPELIATKNVNPNSGLIDKIRHNLSRMVIVRRIDDQNLSDLDGIIARTESLLNYKNYQEALNLLLSLDQKYHSILAKFLSDLNIAAEVMKLDDEILIHLKSLT